MAFRINPAPMLEFNGARARTRAPSAVTETAVLLLATAGGAILGGVLGRTRKSAGIGAAAGGGVAIALIATAEED